MKTYRVRMTEAYGWTAGEVSPDAPNQSAVLTVEDNGTRWISQVNVEHLSLNELADLVDFCKRLPGRPAVSPPIKSHPVAGTSR